MIISGKKEYFSYFLGDIFFFIFSLWLALSLRHFSLPSREFFLTHLTPFSLLFIAWIFVFFAAGLYDKQTAILRKKLPLRIINAQIANGIIAVFFFYLSPYFAIAPKTNLLLYLLVSSVLIIFWRLIVIRFFRFSRKQSALVLLSGLELKEIAEELENNEKYNIDNLFTIDIDEKKGMVLEEEIKKEIKKGLSLIIADFENDKIKRLVPNFYDFLFSGIIFIDAQKIYEELFDKIPISMVEEHWFLKNFYFQKSAYDLIKRFMDIVIAFPLAVASLIFYPFVFLAIKIDDGGSFFIVQERIGQRGDVIKIVKFRSMKKNDNGVWVEKKDERITKAGKFLRKTRIDELPQLWNVLKGDVSLIGPRPDISGLRGKLEKEIPYYNTRDLVRPGLSGWAQIKQDSPPQSIEETKERLMYDFYYIKNRSLALDFGIALRTIQILLSRAGI